MKHRRKQSLGKNITRENSFISFKTDQAIMETVSISLSSPLYDLRINQHLLVDIPRNTSSKVCVLLKNGATLGTGLKTSNVHLEQQSDAMSNRQEQMDSAIILGFGRKVSYEWPETLSLRVDLLVQQQPNVVAIKGPTGVAMTYLQMHKRTNAIAIALQTAGAITGSRVALFCEPSSDAICSLLAIMRIGAVYIPLDVRNSIERLSTIVAESKASIILYHSMTSEGVSRLDISAAKVLDISPIASSKDVVPNQSTASSVAFIMFTSGTTGKPKGIKLKHSNFLTHVAAATDRMKLGKEIVLHQSAFGYDASLAQIFYALANGGRLVIGSNRGDMAELAALILKEKITFTLCAPSEYSVLFQYGSKYLAKCTSWRVAMCGGEAFATHLKRKFYDIHLPSLKVFNAYGPTEVSVACSIGEVNYHGEGSLAEASKVPIGRAMPNYAVYILDERSQPAPLGEAGEICVGGPAVSSGYLSNDELTDAKFLPDEFSRKIENNLEGWDTLYHTGDKGRMLPDGSIIFLGRVDGDTQIKLRGMRIELDDISSTILNSSGGILASAAVISKGEKEQFLVAYIVFERERTPQEPSIYLEQLLSSLPLPVYMRPAVAVTLECLPMNASGKLDMKTLKALPLPQFSRPEDIKLTEVETRLKAIWEDVLSETGAGFHVTKHSDFFSVGGNSLLLLKLQADIRKDFNTNIPLPEIFQNSTLESLALRIEKSNDSSVQDLDWQAETELSPDLLKLDPHFTPLVHKDQIKVVLTGATGFLGRAILRQLIRHNGVSHIRCIAVRPTVSRVHAIESNPKIVYHAGDLSLPLLGMSEEEARLVFDDADAIIHNGAEVSFMQRFQSLRKPNVESTKELVKLSIHRRIPFHFVSTGGVARLKGQDSLEEASVAPYPPPVDGLDGYVASKWASERYLERVNRKLGLPVWIYRPSNIMGKDAPSTDVIQNMLKYFHMMNAVPDLAGWRGYFDFIDVDTVAAGILSHVLGHGQSAINRTPEYIHLSGEIVFPIHDIKKYLERNGDMFKVLEMREWIEAASQLGLNKLVAAFLTTMHDEGHTPSMPLLLKNRGCIR